MLGRNDLSPKLIEIETKLIFCKRKIRLFPSRLLEFLIFDFNNDIYDVVESSIYYAVFLNVKSARNGKYYTRRNVLKYKKCEKTLFIELIWINY